MNDINNLFFELIRVAIGNQVCLSRTPKVKEWQELYDIAKKQSLVGVCFAGVQSFKPSDSSTCSLTENLPETLRLQWMGMAAKIQRRNEIVNGQCVELQKKLKDAGLRSSILKGQGVAALYNENLRTLRQTGDIDVYVDCTREKAIEYAKSIQEVVDWDYKHLHLKIFEDTEVELHYHPAVLMNLIQNAKLQKWFEVNKEMMFEKQDCLVIPTVRFNRFYILLHIYRHYFFEGIGMRQLMDYYFVLSTSFDSENKDLYCWLKQFGILGFAQGVMWIMKTVFGLDDKYIICEIDEEEGRYILNEVIAGGNFGKHNERFISGKVVTSKNWKKVDAKRRLRHSCHLLLHYPSEVSWSVINMLWHFCWKRLHKTQLLSGKILIDIKD